MTVETARDEVRFAEESAPLSPESDLGTWKIMIVDDDDFVHRVTLLTLGDYRFEKRRLEYLHAYSAAEARRLLAEHPDTAVIVLDVVMETENAGLEFARHVRLEARNPLVRIILRTGQPGQAPERTVITEYDINDYRNKAELSEQRLVTSITTAIYDSGFNSNSRFYEASEQLLGMRARDYRAGGSGATIRFAVGQCALGAILVAQSQRGICAILLGDDPDRLVRDLQDQFPKAELIGSDGQFEQLIAQVVGFIEAPAMGLHLPLDVQGTAFQERVWRALREIPPGTTASYTDIAVRIGAPKAVRAVAKACATNHIAVAIPCHRVVRRDGDLAGYRWGVERKRELLRREAKA